MLIKVKVQDEKKGLEFINDILKDLGKEETKDLHYESAEMSISPEIRTKHTTEGPSDITIDNYLVLLIKVGDLDFNTQETIKKHKYMLRRL